MSLLELKQISKSYRRGGLFGMRERFEVLKDVDLSLEPGCCLGLLGRSGSGKSTLGRIALGLERPDSGEVLFNGRPVKSLPEQDYREYRKNIQVVFQNSFGSVNPRWTAGRIIAEPIGNFEQLSPTSMREKVVHLLERVGLRPEAADKLPHQFSGGELQRVCIARAISLSPSLIVLDEAVSSLDMLIQAKVMELLTDLQRETGTAYLFISHDIRVLLRMADRLVVLDEGRIVGQMDRMDESGSITHPAFTNLLEAILPPLPAMLA